MAPKKKSKAGASTSAGAGGGKAFDDGPGAPAVGRTLRKKFARKFYPGKVTEYYPVEKYYHIEYEDGDAEDLFWFELEPLLDKDASKKDSKATSPSKEKATPSKGTSETPAEEGAPASATATAGALAKAADKAAIAAEAVAVAAVAAKEAAAAAVAEEASLEGAKKKRGRPAAKNKAPAAKKQKAQEDPPHRRTTRKSSAGAGPSEPCGQAIGFLMKKKFEDGQLYEGKVVAFDIKSSFYKVKFDDGDLEEYTWQELRGLLQDPWPKADAGPSSG